MTSNDTWYFAYGSNMSVDRKIERTGMIRRAIRSCLSGYRLAFNKRATGGGVCANIMPDEASEVWGVLYLCDETAIQMLNVKEGVASGHYVPKTVSVHGPDDEQFQCMTYVAGPKFICEDGVPSDEYLNHLLVGARDHDLPTWYIDDIRKLATLPSS